MGVGDFFMKHMVLLTLIFLTFGLCANQSDRLVMPSTEENNYPFSDAVKVGNLLFMSGIGAIYYGGYYMFAWTLGIILLVGYEMFRLKWATGRTILLLGMLSFVLAFNLVVFLTSFQSFFSSNIMIGVYSLFFIMVIMELNLKKTMLEK